MTNHIRDIAASREPGGLSTRTRPHGRDKPQATPKPARILIAEDDFFVALEIEETLMGAGYEIVGVVNSADEAERTALSEKPDLIVMDIRLVGRRDGIDAALEIYRKGGIRSIFATAHADARTRKRAEAAAPLGWLAKPYAMESLTAVVHTALAELKK